MIDNRQLVYLSAMLAKAPDRAKKRVQEGLAKADIDPDFLQQLIRQAQQLVAGRNQLSDAPIQAGRSIFERLDNQHRAFQWTYPQPELSLKDSFFPSKERETTPFSWANFIAEQDLLVQSNGFFYADSVLQLLHKHTAAVSCGFAGLEDISFYDLAKMRAGVALSLYDWCVENNRVALNLNNDDVPLLLIAGDLSGIQSFIYDIISKSAAKNLKGRSFYLQLLNESILQLLKKRCGLQDGHIVYASGGGFLAVAPNTPLVKQQLTGEGSLVTDLSLQLYETHRTAFNLVMEAIAVKANDFYNGLSNKIKQLLETELNQKKEQRYRHLIEGDGALSKLFKPAPADIIRDKISGEMIDGKQLDAAYYFDEDSIYPKQATTAQKSAGSNLVLSTTADQIFLGSALRDAKYWIISHEPLAGFQKRFTFDPCNLGVYHYILKAENLTSSNRERLAEKSVQIYRINQVKGFVDPAMGKEHFFGFKLYGGNDFPVDRLGNPKTFNEMAGSKAEDKSFVQDEFGFKRLGVLRMDIDNLGHIFQELRQSTLAHYTTLSRSLDHFFKGYLNELWKEKEENRGFSQIIYSGGDDLFVVGRWDVMIDMAKDIKQSFAKWTTENDYFSISGGIAVVTHKFPIIKAAEMAAAAEKEAKNNFFTPPEVMPELVAEMGFEKNSFSFLGVPLHWKKQTDEQEEYIWMNEFEQVESFKDSLMRLLTRQENKLASAFLQKVQDLYHLRTQAKDNHVDQYRWRWMLANELTKFKDQIQRAGQKNEWNFLKELLNEYILGILSNRTMATSFEGKSKYEFIDMLSVACRWAELEYRTKIS